MAERTSRAPDRVLDWAAAMHLGVALALAAFLVASGWVLARPIALLLIAITIAQALAPLVQWIARWTPRALAVMLVYLVLGALIGLVVWLLLPALVDEGRRVASTLPDIVDRLQRLGDRWSERFGIQIEQHVVSGLNGIASRLLAVPQVLLSSLGEALVVLFLSIYWLIEMPAIRRFTLSLWPEERRDRFAGVFDEMGDAMGGYIRGVALNGAIMGVVAWLGLWVAGVEFALMLGVVTAFGELIPYLGAMLAGALAAGAGLLQSGSKALEVLLLYTALQQIEGHLLTPNIVGRQTQAPAGLVLFAFTAGFAVGGLVGGLVAIPLAAALRVLVIRVVAPAIRERG